MSCELCNDRGHRQIDGKWQRCKCVKAARMKLALVQYGVDVRTMTSTVDKLEANTPSRRKLKAWVRGAVEKLSKGRECPACWITGGSVLEREEVTALLVKAAVKGGYHPMIARLAELIATKVSDETTKRMRECTPLIFIMDSGEGMSPKGKTYGGMLLQNIGYYRMRKGMCTVAFTKEATPVAVVKELGASAYNLLSNEFPYTLKLR